MRTILLVCLGLNFACSTPSVGSAPSAASAPETMPSPEKVSTAKLLRIGGVAVIDTQKNGSTPVGGTVEGIEGEAHVSNIETWEGLEGTLRVPIKAFSTGSEVRDQRIQEVFFNKESWPNAVVEFSSPAGFGKALGVGETQTLSVPGEISVGGGKGSIALDLSISREGSRSYTVVSASPTVLSIEGLGMSEPLSRLMTLCGHESIRDEVNVEFKATITD